jgi:hypothetical protein
MKKRSSLSGHEQDVFGSLTGPGKAQKTAILLDKQGVLGKGCQHQKEEISVFSPDCTKTV